MSFAIEHTVVLAQVSAPEPSPNSTPPLDSRVFRSPSGARSDVLALVGWLEDTPGNVAFQIWARPDGGDWLLLETRETVGQSGAAGIAVPADADLCAAVITSPGDGLLRFAFRGPAVTDSPIGGGSPGATVVEVSNFPSTQGVSGTVVASNLLSPHPISAAALPLPADAARETGNLGTLVGRTPVLGQAAAAASVPVVLPPTQASGELALRSQLPAALVGGRLPVDGSGVAQPSSQSGAWTVSVSSLPGSPAQEHTSAAAPHAARLTDGTSFYAAAKAGDNLGADLRIASAAVSNGNPVPVVAAVVAAGPTSPARKAVPIGAAEPIVAVSTPATRYVRVAGDPANQAPVYVSGIGQASTTNSIPIFANDVVTYDTVANANLLECLAATAGQYLRIEVL